MLDKTVIGVDLGGTKITIGKVEKDHICEHVSFDISSQGTEGQIVSEIINGIKEIFCDDIDGIGIGVPSLVDIGSGIVYDVQNIPSWKEVHLRDILSEHFHVPIYINNDANCFAVGEKYFGQGKNFQNIVGITIGTGLGAGIIIKNHLYSGLNCGAGEFGSVPYLEKTYEYYCSGQFFINEYSERGHAIHDRAVRGDASALEIFQVFGNHLGNAINAILFALDPEAIFLGGSVSKAFPFFKDAMWKRIQTFPYKRTIEKLVINATEYTVQAPIMGAAALYYDAQGGDLTQIDPKICIKD